MRAVLLALKHFHKLVQSQALMIATDNTTVVTYLQNQGETHCHSLYLLLFCQSLKVLYSQTCSRQPEPSSECSVMVTASNEYRVGVASSCLSGDLSQVGSPSFRPLCNTSEFQNSNLCVANSRQQRVSSGHYVNFLESDALIHVPSLSPSSQDSTQNQCKILQDHPYFSSMTKTVVASRSSSALLCETNPSSSQERSAVSVQMEESTSESFQFSSVRLAVVGDSLKQDGFSDRAATRISSSVRKSTGVIYDSKWSIFCSWCRQREIDPLSITV
jgi:hypothetical protein